MISTRIFSLLFCTGCFCSSFSQSIPIPGDTSYNVNAVYRQIYREFPMAVPAKDSLPKGVMAERNVVYTTLPNTAFGNRPLRLDVFRPEKPGMHPAIVMVHGGGWRSGTKEMQVPMAQMLAANGFVTIPVEYQLSLEAKYPAAVHNLKSAIRWVKAHAEKYGVDTARIAISGCSAGGQLAALVGLTNGLSSFEGEGENGEGSSTVNAVVVIDGAIDFMAPSSLNLKRQANSPDVEWLGGTFEEKPLTWKEASPIFWARKESVVPMLFLNGGFSRFHAGQDEPVGMLKEWGAAYEVHPFDIKMRPFWLFRPRVDQTVDYVDAFLKKAFQRK